MTEELWPGVRASPGAYTLSLLRAEIIRELDLAAHGLHVDVHEPYLFAPFPDGRKVVTWSSRERTHAQLDRDWSRGGRRRLRRVERALGREPPMRARPLMLEPPDRERWLEPPSGRSCSTGSIADELAGIPSEEVRVPFAIQGLIGTLAAPDDPGTAFVAFYHDLGEAAGPPGAWGYRARRHGRRDRGAARGGRGGRRARARRCAGRARDRRGGPSGRRRARGRREVRGAQRCCRTPTRVRTAALAGLPEPDGLAPGRPGGEGHAAARRPARLPVLAGARAVGGHDRHRLHARRPRDGRRRRARAGGPPRGPGSRPPARRRPTRRSRRPGRHVLSLFCQCFPVDVDADAAADAAIARFAEVCPQLPDRIVDRLALGPRELEARFGLTGGHIFHGEMLGDQLLERRFEARRFGGIEGLYLAGSGAHPGGAVTGAPGFLAARAVLEDRTAVSPATGQA